MYCTIQKYICCRKAYVFSILRISLRYTKLENFLFKWTLRHLCIVHAFLMYTVPLNTHTHTFVTAPISSLLSSPFPSPSPSIIIIKELRIAWFNACLGCHNSHDQFMASYTFHAILYGTHNDDVVVVIVIIVTPLLLLLLLLLFLLRLLNGLCFKR